jgi:DNA-binding winged helix-turn-helix (wHTH) protein
MSTSSNVGLRVFGPFELDLDRRELRREGARVRLTAKPFDTLAFLVENHRQIVSRDQLRATIWEGLTVSDPAVEHCGAQLFHTGPRAAESSRVQDV